METNDRIRLIENEMLKRQEQHKLESEKYKQEARNCKDKLKDA